MRVISSTHSLAAYLDELEFTEAALRADPETSSLAAPFAESIVEWDTVFLAERSARLEVTRAEAVVEVRGAQLAEMRKHIAAQALVEAGSDRNDASFVRIFPISPWKMSKRPLRKQCEFARDVIAPEIAKRPDDSPLKAFLPGLNAQCSDVFSALDTRATRQAQRQSVARDVDDYKRRVNVLRETTHAELRKIAATSGKARSWADTFFRHVSPPDTAAHVEPVPAPNGG